MTAVEFIEPLSHDEGVKNATDLFRATYGEEPAGVWAAPGRVNLIGEHTDYNAGLCLPIALPHRTFIALKPREDTKVRVVSDVDSENVTEADLDGLQAGGVEGWAAYPVGVAWALREAGFDAVQGFDAAFSSCVPLGSGLSSSAAMTCSTALALDDVYGLGYGASDAGRVTLINAAIKSENDMAGASTGGLDQNASMRCTFGHALRLDCRPELSPLENVSQQAQLWTSTVWNCWCLTLRLRTSSTTDSMPSVAPLARRPPKSSAWPTCVWSPTASPSPTIRSRRSRKRSTSWKTTR